MDIGSSQSPSSSDQQQHMPFARSTDHRKYLKRKSSGKNLERNDYKRKLNSSTKDLPEFKRRKIENEIISDGRVRKTSKESKSSSRKATRGSSTIAFVKMDQYKEMETERDRYKRKCYEYEKSNNELKSQLADARKQLQILQQISTGTTRRTKSKSNSDWKSGEFVNENMAMKRTIAERSKRPFGHFESDPKGRKRLRRRLEKSYVLE